MVAEHGWDHAITVEGWESAVYVARPEGALEETRPILEVAVLGDQGRLIVRVPMEVLGEGDPAAWGYAAVVLSREGFPSSGVRRVRDVQPVAEQYRAGGAAADANHTRIFDLVWPEPGIQEEMLSDYPPRQGSLDDVEAAELPKVPMLVPDG